MAVAALFINTQANAQEGSRMAAGYSHNLYLTDNNQIIGWGKNEGGELFVNSSDKKVTPQVLAEGDFASIAAGYNSTAIIKKDHSLWVSGYNNMGQLGLGHNDDVAELTQVGNENNWVKVSIGYRHMMALKSDGTIWAWGANDKLQLGKADDAPSLVPIQVGNDSDWVDVAAGHNSSFAIKSDGTLWAWGYNYAGQLGIGNTSNTPTPTKVESDKKWKTVEVGISFAAGIKEDGSLWTWGRNYAGELGDGKGNRTSEFNSSIPVNVASDIAWKKIRLGKEHALAIKEDNTLWIWGSNTFGKLGIGEPANYNFYINAPKKVNDDTDWLDIGSAERHNIAIKTDGTIWGWGSNQFDQLVGNNNYEISPILIFDLKTLSTNEVATQEEIRVYPTSVQDILHIEAPHAVHIQVYNAQGQLSLETKNVSEISLSSLAKGVYFVRLATQNQTKTVKIIKK